MAGFFVGAHGSCEDEGDGIFDVAGVVVAFSEDFFFDFVGQDGWPVFFFHIVIFEPVMIKAVY